jgi:hypothetical protein
MGCRVPGPSANRPGPLWTQGSEACGTTSCPRPRTNRRRGARCDQLRRPVATLAGDVATSISRGKSRARGSGFSSRQPFGSSSRRAHEGLASLSPTSCVTFRPVRGRGILYWQRCDGHAEAELGRSWVIETDGTERLINDGDPISRAEAARLADVGDYVLDAEE